MVKFRKNWVFDDFLPSDALFLVNYQNRFEKILCLAGYWNSLCPENLFFEELAVIELMPPSRSKGELPKDHLIEDDSNWPDISLYDASITLRPYFSLLMTSGAIVHSVPRRVWKPMTSSLWISSFLEKPKSPILNISLCLSTFSAFKSRCTICFECSYYIIRGLLLLH